jgi:hypothetical protein
MLRAHKNLTRVLFLSFLVIIAALCVNWYSYTFLVTFVDVWNVGDQPLDEVILHVSGRSYTVGTIHAQTHTTVSVVPQFESHLEIEFTSQNGRRKLENAGGYFAPNIPADVFVEMDGLGIRSRRIEYR